MSDGSGENSDTEKSDTEKSDTEKSDTEKSDTEKSGAEAVLGSWPEGSDAENTAAGVAPESKAAFGVDPESGIRDYAAVEVPAEVAGRFWALVVLVNIGVFGLVVGTAMAFLTELSTIAAGLVLVGLLALSRAVVRYRRHRND